MSQVRNGMPVIVSVVIPLYNGKQYVASLIELLEKNAVIYKENCPNEAVEVLFVNDNPFEKIEQECFASDILTVRYIPLEKHLGIHGTRAVGVRNACGEYVLLLDQDDRLADNYLFSQLSKAKVCGISLCNGYHRQSQKIYSSLEEHTRAWDYKRFREKCQIISPGQVVMRKSLIPDIWLHSILIHNGTDDYLLWLCLLKARAKVAVNPDFLYWHCEDGRNTSFNWQEMIASREELEQFVFHNKILTCDDFLVFSQCNRRGINKYRSYQRLDRLISDYQKGKIKRPHIRRVALYGMGIYGEKIYNLLRTDLEVVYAIDKRADAMLRDDIRIMKPSKSLPTVEAVIVTVPWDFERVKSELSKLISYPVISIEQILGSGCVSDDSLGCCTTVEFAARGAGNFSGN